MSFASTITPEEIEQAAMENSLGMIGQTIPDDLLYEVVDGKIVEKRIGARESEIATILGGFLFQFARAHRLGRAVVELMFRIDPEKILKRHQMLLSYPVRAGLTTTGSPRSRFGIWSPTLPTRLSMRVTPLMKFRKNVTSTLMPE